MPPQDDSSHFSPLRNSRRVARLFIAVLFACAAGAHGAIPAFPGAEGYGAYAVGGRNGDVYHVTNLNASGTGSFAEGIATVPSAGRTIVFDVSGYIRFPSGSNGTRMTASKVTIAGQTAPGDGIGFYNNFFRISGDDIVIRHVRFRYGKQSASGDCVDLDSGSLNSILDHVSMQFSTDENMSSFGSPPENVTLQYSLNAWGLESHSCGGLWDQNHATAHHNLWAHNHTRNPKSRPTGLLEWINNVTFDWDIGFIMGDTTSVQNYKANVIGNYFICPPGNIRSKALEKASLATNGLPNFTVHLSGNLTDNNGDGILNGTDKGYTIVEGSSYTQSASAIAGSTAGVSTDNALTAYKKIVSNAGALRLDAGYTGTLRDEVDTILLTKLVTRTRFHITRESDTGASNSGFGTLKTAAAPADTDRDGMPDYYETALGWSVSTDDHATALASSGGFITGTTFFPAATPAGYTRLEEYLHFLAIPHGTLPKSLTGSPSVLTIDLRKFSSGFSSSPAFTVANVVGGSVILSGAGNAIATFTAGTTPGRARFEFTVTDSEGSTWTQTFAMVVAANALPRDLVWKGAGNLWDGTASNWIQQSTGATVEFSSGDRVTFDETGVAQQAVTVSGGQQPGSVTVTAGDYVLSGPGGAIASTGELIKRGAGTLTLSDAGPNSFSSVSVDEGWLSLSNFSAGGTGKMSMNGGSLTLASGTANALEFNAPTIISVGSQQTMTGNWTGTQEVTVNGTSSHLWSLSGTWTGFAGSIKLGTGNVKIRLNGGSSNTMFGGASVAVDLGSGSSQFMNRNGTTSTPIEIGSLSATGTATQLQGTQTGTTNSTYNIGGLNTNTTFSGAIVNGGSGSVTNINKVGTGTLALAGTSTYTGATTVSAGRLAVDGVLGNTPVTVQSGATLSLNGALGNTLTVASGGIIAPGANAGASPGALTVNGLTAAAATYTLDLTSNPVGTNDKIVIANNGTAALSGSQYFQINLVDGVLGAGNYMLIDNPGTGPLNITSVSLASNMPTTGTRQKFTVKRNAGGTAGGDVWLEVTGSAVALTWSGSAGNLWQVDTSATANGWTGGTLAEPNFLNVDAVTFDDAAPSAAVAISGLVQPRTINVSNSSAKNYTFSGNGAITGDAVLAKSGTGTLTITLPASVGIASTNSADSTSVTVTDATGLAAGMSVSGNGVAVGTTITAISGTTLTFSQPVTAANSAATFTYSWRNTFTGGTTIGAGSTILLGNDSANAYGLGTGAITFNGGTLSMFSNLSTYNGATFKLAVPAGQTGTFNADSRCDLYGTLTGGGTLNFRVPWIRTDLYSNWSAFTGIINVTTDGNAEPGGGTPTSGDLRMSTDYNFPGFPLATVNLGDKVYACYTGILNGGAGTTIEIGELAGTSSSVLMGGVTGGRNFTYRIGAKTPLGGDVIFAGTVAEQNTATTTNYVKTGAGTWTLSGACTWNGGTTVEQGTLRISGSLANGGAVFQVLAGARLDLANGSITTSEVTVSAAATLTGRGTITGDLTNAGTITCTSGTLSVTGEVVNNGTMRFTGGATLNAGGHFVNNGVIDLLTGAQVLPADFENNGVVIDSSSLSQAQASMSGTTFTLSARTYAGHSYQLQRADSLSAPVWTNIGTAQAGDGTVRAFLDAGATGPQRFYRVQVTP